MLTAGNVREGKDPWYTLPVLTARNVKGGKRHRIAELYVFFLFLFYFIPSYRMPHSILGVLHAGYVSIASIHPSGE